MEELFFELLNSIKEFDPPWWWYIKLKSEFYLSFRFGKPDDSNESKEAKEDDEVIEFPPPPPPVELVSGEDSSEKKEGRPSRNDPQ